MPLLQSLFCLKGKDNRERFTIIQLSAVVLFVLFNTLLGGNTIILLLLALAITSISALSALRRCNDANLTNKILLLPSALLFVTCLLVIFTESSSFNFALFLPLLSQLYLLTFKGHQKELEYHLGYNGPIDLSSTQPNYQSANVRRVEPTLVGSSAHSAEAPVAEGVTSNSESIELNQPTTSNSTNDEDIGEKVRELLFAHKQKLLIGLAVLTLLTVLFVIVSNQEPAQDTVVEPIVEPLVTQDYLEQSNVVELSDGFSVASNPFQGIVISWQADDTLRTELWNITTAEGDESCKELTFNNKQSIRTSQVMVKNNSQYYAVFSPLDSHSLVNQLAKRGSFKLCGYDFSLKGSQAALGKVRYYGELLSY